MTQPKTISELKEKLADIEHQRWSDWQSYVHSKLQKGINENNFFTLPIFYYERWERQLQTPYLDLSEKEKDSDRDEVDRYLPTILSFLASEVEKMKHRPDIYGELTTEESSFNEGLYSALTLINNFKN